MKSVKGKKGCSPEVSSLQKLRAEEVVPGMKLGEDITASTGAVLMPAGSVLTEKAIESFVNWNVSEVRIIDEEDEKIARRHELEQQFMEKYNASVSNVMGLMERLEKEDELDPEEARSISEDLSELTKDYSYIKLFSELENKEQRTYQHSINVGIYAAMLARWLGFDNAVTRELVLTGVLHDIGKAKIDREIFDKAKSFNEEAQKEIQKHPIYGFNIVNRQTKFNYNVARGVLEHHERMTGTGYPEGKTGYQIHLHGKIVAVTNVFDHIVSDGDSNSSDGEYTFSDLDALAKNTDQFDITLTQTFTKHIYNIFIGSQVELSDERTGEIVMMNRDEITRPLVKLNDGEFIDLNKERSLVIKRILKL